MFKTIFGFLLGCFITYNYIIPNPDYRALLDNANVVLLELIQSAENQLKENVNNKSN